MERTEAELIAAVLRGDPASFEPLVQKYSPRVFATARRYARRQFARRGKACGLYRCGYECCR